MLALEKMQLWRRTARAVDVFALLFAAVFAAFLGAFGSSLDRTSQTILYAIILAAQKRDLG